MSVARWFFWRRIGLPICVTRTFFLLAIRLLLGPSIVAAANDIANLLTTLGGDLARRDTRGQRLESRLNHIMRIGSAYRLRNDILHSKRFENRTHRSAGDYTGTWGGITKRNTASAVAAVNIVVKRPTLT